MYKENNILWKIFNSKFGSPKKQISTIDGLSDEYLIANRFATYFTEVPKNKKETIFNFRNKFHDQLVNYLGDACTDTVLDIETIDLIFRKLKKGKQRELIICLSNTYNFVIR